MLLTVMAKSDSAGGHNESQIADFIYPKMKQTIYKIYNKMSGSIKEIKLKHKLNRTEQN